jgi:hypothetical protein
MRLTATLAIGSLCLLASAMARAADQTVLGNVLTVKNPSTAGKRKILGKAKEPGSPNTIVGNPTVGGGTLTIRADGGTPTTQTFTLPQGISGMKYKDAKGENTAVKSVLIRKNASGVFLIKVVVSGKIGTLSVVPPDPGTAGCVFLSLSGGDSYSVLFGAGSTFINKDGLLFKAKKPTAEGSPTTTTTSTTSSTTSTTLYGSPSRAFIDRVPGLLD